MVRGSVCLLGTTTFHLHLICQPSPYSEAINEQQDDIVLEDSIPKYSEDSAMDDAEPETQEVSGMAIATRPSTPPCSSYRATNVSPSAALAWPHVETTAFVDTMALIFEPLMLRELLVPNSVALQRSVFTQAMPQQGNAPLFITDQVQASTFVAESNVPKYQ